jgi:hypothetical protein
MALRLDSHQHRYFRKKTNYKKAPEEAFLKSKQLNSICNLVCLESFADSEHDSFAFCGIAITVNLIR